MKTINLNAWGTNHPISFYLDNYAENDNLYVGLITTEDGYAEPWSDLTVNLGDKLPANCAYIDTNNNGQQIVEWLMKNNLGKPTGRYGFSGFCSYPLFEFDMDELSKYLITEDEEDAD